MTAEQKASDMLSMLLAMCDRLKAEAQDAPIVWDERKPTIYYLQRNMEFARELLKSNE
jgi:hypothetical protein